MTLPCVQKPEEALTITIMHIPLIFRISALHEVSRHPSFCTCYAVGIEEFTPICQNMNLLEMSDVRCCSKSDRNARQGNKVEMER